jgi:dCTP deaminase
MSESGILPDHSLRALIAGDALRAATPWDRDQVQPASLDLRLGKTAWRLRASFLPGAQRTVEDRVADRDLALYQIDLSQGALLEPGAVYLVQLDEALSLPHDVAAIANPKSSTGRLDVFVRVIADRAVAFDVAPAGYHGPLWIEIAPRTFPILARSGDRLAQLRLRRGDVGERRPLDVSVDLANGFGGVAGFRARRHAPLVDLRGIGVHDPISFFEPLTAPNGRLVLDPGEFYILASSETVVIPAGEAAEMAPIAPEIGEFRAHYAGFFDPGFGLENAGGAGARAVLEVRGRDVPFVLEHGQPVARLLFEPLISPPTRLYGSTGSNYQGQSLKLSKHFKAWL